MDPKRKSKKLIKNHTQSKKIVKHEIVPIQFDDFFVF